MRSASPGTGPQAAATHLEALRRFPFATVLTPLNPVLWREHGFREAWAALVAEVRRQDAGLMTIKAVSRRSWPDAVTGRAAAAAAVRHLVRADVRARADPCRGVVGAGPRGGHRASPRRATSACCGTWSPPRPTGRTPAEAEARLADLPGYSSPFLAMPA